MGETHDETVVHMVANKDKFINDVSHNEPKARTKSGAPMVPTNASDSLVDRFMVKPKLSKMTLPRFNSKITEFREFWDRFKTVVHNNQSLLMVDKFTYLRALLEGMAA